MNKQLHTDKNSSRRAPEYNNRAAEILCSAETEESCIEKLRKHLAYVTHLPVQQFGARRGPLSVNSPSGEKESMRPQQPSSPLLTPVAFTTKGPHSLHQYGTQLTQLSGVHATLLPTPQSEGAPHAPHPARSSHQRPTTLETYAQAQTRASRAGVPNP